MTLPSLMRCNMVTAGIATNLGIEYTSFLRGWWMLVWFKSGPQRTEFFTKYAEVRGLRTRQESP